MRRRSLVLLLLLLPTLATAQTPTPADTIRPDSALVTADPGLLSPDTVLADSLRPAPHLPDFPEPDSAAFWSGTWSWDREDLLRFQGTSLLELLVSVPGLGMVRAGGFGQPAGLSPFALGGGRTRLFVDGWEMDPLNSAVFDLQKLSLVDIESLRVERRLHELRIRVTTFRLADSRPFSQVDAATGDPETRYLRGLYSQRIGGRSILTLGFDLTDTDGFFSGESFGVTTGIARWGFLIDPRAGIQVELRQAEVERATRFVDRGRRRDLLVRGRWNPTDALSLAAVAGRVTRAPEERDRFEAAEVSQLGLRSFLRLPAGVWMEGDLRLRSVSAAAFPAARSDLSLAAGVRPTALLELRGEARAASVAGEQGGEFLGGARFGPVRGISFFGSMTLGGRAVGILRADT
ncbi:MAG: TonB-dependent receptor plug domain-containing protein, partial [Gemmatimonadota bacterium]|nr:TonB-dependent receptor plug domain-containing protein [Gemmatimonadota bacterium]